MEVDFIQARDELVTPDADPPRMQWIGSFGEQGNSGGHLTPFMAWDR
ncbi:hypothetical protein BOO71_0006388 [Deinococcus marmoris]|uniref:Uncharacterized protein n=1 Tax=Deinococcus marmoris TaxID=249408 RepID=A0A1U7NZ85_9DEIO|nr:hypothetical protein BOO71_0006388 [Deinococcus marmoris]